MIHSFTVYSSGGFSIFTALHHHCCVNYRTVITLERSPVLFSYHPTFHLPSPRQQVIYFLAIDLSILHISYK